MGRARFRQLFGIDVRTLALLRISLASLVLLDLCLRARDLSAHYTDGGVLPRDILIEEFLTRWQWSFHLFNGTSQFQALLFAMAGVVALAMLVGFRTRVTTVLTWVLLCSVQTRNPAIGPAVDDALRLFVFWSMFLPLGAVWSVDAMRSPRGLDNPVVSVASVGIMVQVALIYVVTVVLKSDPAWRSDFTAIYYALSLDEMATSIGLAVRNYPALMKVLTFVTFALEIIAPVAVFVPVMTAKVRMVAIAAMMLLHLGMGLCLTIGMFPYVMWVGWWAFLPGEFWDRLGLQTGLIADAQPARLTRSQQLRHWGPQLLAAIALVYVLAYSGRVVDRQRYWFVVSPSMNAFGSALKLKQNWGVFAPRPHSGDGWYVMPAMRRDGVEIDLFRGGGPVSYDKPARITDDYANDRWRKYLLHLRSGESKRHAPLYLDYLCRDWNGVHLGTNQMVSSVRLYFMEEYTLPDGQVRPIERKLLLEHPCP
ncbi:MAG: HTTM domain-containing protein [Myxococcota bacterium]